MNYYCLIAGLPDIEIEDNKLLFGVSEFREDVRPHLWSDDLRLFDLYYTKFDNHNLLNYLIDKDYEFSNCGNISKDDLEECIKLYSEGDVPKNRHIPVYFKTFIDEYIDSKELHSDKSKWENRLTELYYRHAMLCGNNFISEWFEFNLNLNNVLSAFTSRKYQTETAVLGDNEVSDLLRTSSHRDFGLSGIVEDLDVFQRLADEKDLFEREKKIDLLKWHWLEERTFFKYFSIERIFAYLVKLEIIERWVGLDSLEGGKIFRELIDNLKGEVMNSQKDGY